MYRHVIEVHLTSQDADDAIVWQIADLARQRMRQLHGLRYDEDPERATELLGPVLADWVSHDRRHRYVPGRAAPALLGRPARRGRAQDRGAVTSARVETAGGERRTPCCTASGRS